MNDTPYPNGLTECMAMAGITDSQLAAAAGTTKQQIFKLRRGERKMTVQWAKRLAPLLDVTWQELIEGPASPEDRSRAELLRAFELADEQGKEMLLRMARMVQADSERTAESDRTPEPRPGRSAACVMPITGRSKLRSR